MNINTKNQLRYSKSLGGGFSGTPNEVWGTIDYIDRNKPTVFFGMYDLRDYISLWRHKGKAWILWCGGDLNNLDRGFVLNDGKLRWISKLPFFKPLLIKLLKKAENWVENDWEADILYKHRIIAGICPSFLGDISKYRVSFKPGNKVYLSCSGGRYKQYGWDLIEEIADKVPEITFYLYGSNNWKTKHKNVILRGRISQKQMNKEVSKMQAGIRPLEFDGCSEVVVKSVLWGQHPISRINYPFVDNYKTKTELINLLKKLPKKKKPNLKARNWFLNNLNRYPWQNWK